MKIHYKHGNINDPDGSNYVADLSDFILLFPDIGLIIKKGKLIPPRSVLQEILRAEKKSFGMSGYFEWGSIDIDDQIYNEFKCKLESGLGAKYEDFGEQNISHKAWISKARSSYRRNKT